MKNIPIKPTRIITSLGAALRRVDTLAEMEVQWGDGAAILNRAT